MELRQKGSHVSLEKRVGDQVFKTVVPMHSQLAIGTLSDILKQCGLTLDEFLETNVRAQHAALTCNAYRFAAYSSTYAFTVSNASAEFVNRLEAKCSSICRTNKSRSVSLANSTATPLSLSGPVVGTARNSLQLNPCSPGNVVQPTWYTILISIKYPG